MTLLIKNKNLVCYLNLSESEALNEIKFPEKPVLVVSDDFVDLGFVNMVLSAPLGKIWTYFPIMFTEEIFVKNYAESKKYYKDEEEIKAYFKKNGVKLRSINENLFSLFNFHSNKALGIPGDYWQVVIPCEKADDFVDWLKRAVDLMMKYACSREYANHGRWGKGYFSELGDWSQMWVMFKEADAQKTFKKIYGDVRYPTPRFIEEIKFYAIGLDDLARAFFSEGVDRFLAGNSRMQTSLAIPYVEDSYEYNCSYEDHCAIMNLIKKRINYMIDFDMPHFYKSVKYGIWSDRISATDQMRHLVKRNRSVAQELESCLHALEEYAKKMENRYAGLLAFL